MTLSPWLTMIWLGENANDLKSHAPTLLGSVILNPPPVGIVEFSGGFSAGCVGPFCMQVSHFVPALIFVIPSRCTVFIQNSLVVELLGLICTTAAEFVDPVKLFLYSELESVCNCGCPFTCWLFWPLVPTNIKEDNIVATITINFTD